MLRAGLGVLVTGKATRVGSQVEKFAMMGNWPTISMKGIIGMSTQYCGVSQSHHKNDLHAMAKDQQEYVCWPLVL